MSLYIFVSLSHQLRYAAAGDRLLSRLINYRWSLCVEPDFRCFSPKCNPIWQGMSSDLCLSSASSVKQFGSAQWHLLNIPYVHGSTWLLFPSLSYGQVVLSRCCESLKLILPGSQWMRLNMTLQVTGSEVLKARGISIDMQPIKVDADRLVDLPKVIATCNQDHKHN